MNLSDKKCPIGVPFGHAACVALEEVARMQGINDGSDSDEPDDWQIRRLLQKAESDLLEVQRLARGGSPSGL